MPIAMREWDPMRKTMYAKTMDKMPMLIGRRGDLSWATLPMYGAAMMPPMPKRPKRPASFGPNWKYGDSNKKMRDVHKVLNEANMQKPLKLASRKMGCDAMREGKEPKSCRSDKVAVTVLFGKR